MKYILARKTSFNFVNTKYIKKEEIFCRYRKNAYHFNLKSARKSMYYLNNIDDMVETSGPSEKIKIINGVL